MKTFPVEITPATAKELVSALKSDAYLVLTHGGKPVAYVLAGSVYDEEDIGYMTDPEFWKMVAERRKEDNHVALETVLGELGAEAHPPLTQNE